MPFVYKLVKNTSQLALQLCDDNCYEVSFNKETKKKERKRPMFYKGFIGFSFNKETKSQEERSASDECFSLYIILTNTTKKSDDIATGHSSDIFQK